MARAPALTSHIMRGGARPGRALAEVDESDDAAGSAPAWHFSGSGDIPFQQHACRKLARGVAGSMVGVARLLLEPA